MLHVGELIPGDLGKKPPRASPLQLQNLQTSLRRLAECKLTPTVVNNRAVVLRELKNAGDILAKAKKKRLSLDHFLVERARLVFSTVSCAARSVISDCSFSAIVLDEACQCCEVESMIICALKGLKKLVCVGDPLQLPSTTISTHCKAMHYGRSLFDRLTQLHHAPILLNIQYREAFARPMVSLQVGSSN